MADRRVNNLIGLAGKAGAGKDSVARILVDEYGYTRIAFADALKRVLERVDPVVDDTGEYLTQMLYDFDGNWDQLKQFPKVRLLLQDMGTAIRDIDPLFWIKAADIPDDGVSRAVVTDVRLLNEVSAIKDRGGIVYRVVRSGLEAVNGHHTETELDGYLFPTIGNSGTLGDLRTTVKEMMEE